MNFKNKLRQFLPHAEILPKGFIRYGHAVILRAVSPLSPDVGDAVLQIFPWATSVYQYLTTVGENRRPVIKFLSGIDSPCVIHKENGVKYSFNLYHTMFSAGNLRLRQLLVNYVSPQDTLLDMFAAVGNLSLQPVFHNHCEYVAIEKDPITFQSLVKTLALNNIEPLFALNIDSRLLSLSSWASCIFMGYHEVDYSHVSVALHAAKDRARIFMHPICKSGHPEEWISLYSRWITSLNFYILSYEIIHIKQYSPGLSHYMFIFLVCRNQS